MNWSPINIDAVFCIGVYFAQGCIRANLTDNIIHRYF